MKKQHFRRDLILTLLIPGLFLGICLSLMCFSYEVNDDLAMIAILNGSYTGTPEAHCAMMGYPLSLLIASLYSLCNSVGWYQVVMVACIYIAIASILWRVLQRLPERPVLSCVLVISAVTMLWVFRIMRFTYSTGAAFLLASTILCFALQTGEEDTKPGYLINILLLFFLAHNLRHQFGYLAIPFVGVLWLAKHWRELFSSKKCWIVPLAAALVFGLSCGADELAYLDWSEFYEYNEARYTLQDYYGVPDYDECAELISSYGLTEDEYNMIANYDYCLLEKYSPELMEELSEYVLSSQEDAGLISTLKSTVKKTLNYYLVSKLSSVNALVACSYLLPALLLVCSVALSIKDRKWYIVFPFLLLFGIGCSWLLIAYMGRFPIRVQTSLRLLTIAASLAGLILLFRERPLRFGGERFRRWAPILLAAVCVASAGKWFLYTMNYQQEPRDVAVDYEVYAAEHPENIYFRETRSAKTSTYMTEFPRQPVNLISTGSWIAYSPLYEEKLAYLGLEDGISRDTLLEDNVYLICREDYSLRVIMGLPSGSTVEYEVVQECENDIYIVKITGYSLPESDSTE
ncbi:MAG: hypothetical protein LUH16_00130 [Clostridiales bacterium]|nr:hypothetical protein [Clostridiales bacterium]